MSSAHARERGALINSTISGSWTVCNEAPCSGVDPTYHLREEGLHSGVCLCVNSSHTWNEQVFIFCSSRRTPVCEPHEAAEHGLHRPSQSSSPASVPESPRSFWTHLHHSGTCAARSQMKEMTHCSKAAHIATHTHFLRRSRNKT